MDAAAPEAPSPGPPGLTLAAAPSGPHTESLRDSQTGFPPWRLVLLAKDPRPGLSKTRLARDLGEEEAADLYRAFLRDLASALVSPRWSGVVASPDGEAEGFLRSTFGPPWSHEGQGDGELGERLARCARWAFERGGEAVVLCGSDAPTLSAMDVLGAFEALRSHDVSLAPSPDGGYALLGLVRSVTPELLLRGVRWSTEHALDDTLAAARRAGFRACLLAGVPDVDVASDLPAVEARLREDPSLAPSSRQALERLRGRGLGGRAAPQGREAHA